MASTAVPARCKCPNAANAARLQVGLQIERASLRCLGQLSKQEVVPFLRGCLKDGDRQQPREAVACISRLTDPWPTSGFAVFRALSRLFVAILRHGTSTFDIPCSIFCGSCARCIRGPAAPAPGYMHRALPGPEAPDATASDLSRRDRFRQSETARAKQLRNCTTSQVDGGVSRMKKAE